MKDLKNLKVAIVHDWLIGGGAELVVLELHKMFPEAPIYTSFCSEEWRNRMDDKVVTGFLQKWPFSKLRKFIPFMRIWWFSRLNLNDYDLVISSSGAEAKGIRTNTLHVNYCHAPTHYYWSRYDEYLRKPGFGLFDPLARFGLKFLVGPLRSWDYRAAQRPAHMIANSSHTQAQIRKYYQRDSIVIHPPIDVDRFSAPRTTKRIGFIITGRQTPYKRIDLAVAACTQLGLPLKVVGAGPEHENLKKIAGPSITFLGHVDHDQLPELLSSAEAFIFPGLDDFGIAPVEALATGTPVISYKAGGALDYVVEGQTGMFFEQQTIDSLSEALSSFKSENYNSDDIKAYAQKFKSEVFRDSFKDYLTDVVSAD